MTSLAEQGGLRAEVDVVLRVHLEPPAPRDVAPSVQSDDWP